MARATSVTRLLGLLLVSMLLLAGCGDEFPKDPEGTLQRVQEEGQLRVGASLAPPFVTLPDGVEDNPEGSEIALVEDFAASQGALVVWTVNGEEALFGQLERGELDMVVGGLTAQNPYAEVAALTRPYRKIVDAHGEVRPHVMAVRMGENALLVELERFLDQQQFAQPGAGEST